MAKEVEHLLSKLEAPSSIPSTGKKKDKKYKTNMDNPIIQPYR
jgi:hypothetical protein